MLQTRSPTKKLDFEALFAPPRPEPRDLVCRVDIALLREMAREGASADLIVSMVKHMPAVVASEPVKAEPKARRRAKR
jgi:hypothetical protein